ncbi:hypothetical protein F2Q69_00055626 [Brassica cretica]|uniref:PB1-like domain-containing protein n=1 Tax=Brassica cretica TaxID=69181 RepID=A0A8S9MUI9_BRACR|nr:hypothetical protein F2Q69_00055626 [Brassica cretica]
MSEIDGLRMHIGYGGSMSCKGGKFSYSGGVYVRDLSIDPDLLTWSIFEDFIADRGIKSKVEQVWYKIVNEDISTARSICKDKDVEIRKLCEETKVLSEVDFYIVETTSHHTSTVPRNEREMNRHRNPTLREQNGPTKFNPNAHARPDAGAKFNIAFVERDKIERVLDRS